MRDLIDFLFARIADDERKREAILDGLYALEPDYPPLAVDVERQARAGRELTALRKVIERCVHSSDPREEDHALADNVLCALASIWNDHPEYREEWGL